MNKIFDWAAGSNLDQVSGTAGINTAVVYAEGEKGMEGRFTRNEYISNTNFSFSGDTLSYVVWFKENTSTDLAAHLICGNSYSNRLQVSQETNIAFNTTAAGGSGIVFDAAGDPVVLKNQWHFLYFQAYNSGANLKANIYLNGEWGVEKTLNSYNLGSMSALWIGRWDGAINYGLNGSIAKVTAYGETLTTPQINNLYAEYQRATNLIEKKSQFIYPKPTSLTETGLVAAYNMDKQGTALADISGNGNTGTVYGTSQTIEGLKFDGVDDYVCRTALSEITYSSDYTVNIRVKAIGVNGSIFKNILGASDRSSIVIMSNEIRVGHWSGSSYSSKSGLVVSGEFVNVSFVHLASGVNSLYINGIEQTGVNNPSSSSATGMWLGCKSNISDFFNGEIEDLRIYSRALSETEVQAWHNQYAKQPNYINTFKWEGVGNTPYGWD